jgi:hypothetical protein
MRAARAVAVLWPAFAAFTITMQACTSPGPRNEEPDLTGLVESIDLHYGFLELANVVFRWGGDKGDRATIRTYEATVVQYPDSTGTWVSGSPRDIRVGATIRVWTNGVELRSDPLQYGAERIEMASPQ